VSQAVPLETLWHGAGLDPAGIPVGTEGIAVTGVAYDSRVVGPGDLFVAIQGERFDGATFAMEAQERGAVAVVAQSAPVPGISGPWIQTTEPREALARLSAEYHGNPSHELLVVGTTGTNGKTTTTYLIEGILEEAGIPCGRVSSVSYCVGDGEERSAERTTPESSDLQAMLRDMVANGRQGCVMEVSSHALDLHRVDAIRFAAGIFTNLTRDHLDYHIDMSSYFAAKEKLFAMLDPSSPAVVNVDDPYGQILSKEVGRPVTYAIDSPADIRPDRLDLSLDGVELDVRTPRGALHLKSRLPGRHNAYNVLAAAATGTALSVPFRAIERGLASVESVPGRMELVSGSDDDVGVVVDFAHTDDALKGLLDTARPLARGRLITVLGCGGDRDRTKRPLMGTVASRLSDLVVITSDNPRSEDPAAIASDIEAGVAAGDTPWLTVLDREEAIVRAIGDARPGDLVVVAGKGHERFQVIGSRSLPFEDAVVARDALARRRSSTRVG
jgi:UDP-N-acetylmuramoyl-L-alanyl-D-glutamate--2,6-diaminopimelate ligase